MIIVPAFAAAVLILILHFTSLTFISPASLCCRCSHHVVP